MTIHFSSQITVCGDTHGQYFDLNNIFKLNGNPSASNPYLFNGDFVDRGSWGLEVFITLLGWKLHDDKCMYLTRGNHEEGLHFLNSYYVKSKNIENQSRQNL